MKIPLDPVDGRQSANTTVCDCNLLCFVSEHFSLQLIVTPPPDVFPSVFSSLSGVQINPDERRRDERVCAGSICSHHKAQVRDNVHADIAIRGSDAWKTGKNKSPQQMRRTHDGSPRGPIFEKAADEPNVAMKVQEVVKSC